MSVLRLDVTLFVADDAQGGTLANAAFDWLTNPTRWASAQTINRNVSGRLEMSRVKLQRCYHDEADPAPCVTLRQTETT